MMKGLECYSQGVAIFLILVGQDVCFEKLVKLKANL